MQLAKVAIQLLGDRETHGRYLAFNTVELIKLSSGSCVGCIACTISVTRARVCKKQAQGQKRCHARHAAFVYGTTAPSVF